MINVSRLKKGMIIKNYKELCGLLDMRVTSGNGKINQLNELKLYCEYHKNGNKFVIDEVYNNPTITIKDLLKVKNSKYINLISNIIVEYMYKHPAELENIPLFKFLEILGITNKNYSVVNTYKKEFSQLYDVQMASIYYFYSNTKNDFKRMIERCLNNLQKRSVLFWRKCVMIVDKDKGIIYKADKDTEKEILNTQRETLKYMGLNNMYEVMSNKKSLSKFNSIVSKELGFNYYYAYDLTVGDRALQIEYNYIQNTTNLNKLIINKTYNKFTDDKFISYYSDYEKLIEMLIYNSNDIKLLYDELKDKHKENIYNYTIEKNKEDITHEKIIEEIEKKYLE